MSGGQGRRGRPDPKRRAARLVRCSCKVGPLQQTPCSLTLTPSSQPASLAPPSLCISGKVAPITAQHIFKLVSLGAYTGNHFFRVDKGWVAEAIGRACERFHEQAAACPQSICPLYKRAPPPCRRARASPALLRPCRTPSTCGHLL